MTPFAKTSRFLQNIDLNTADPLDKIAKELLDSEEVYERASQALRRRFVRGAEFVPGMDRGNRVTRIKRLKLGGRFKYYIEGADGSWNEPDERIWVVAMYALWQKNQSS